MKSKLSCIALLTFSALILRAQLSFAQTAEITGRIMDSSGAVIPDVAVTVTNVETGIKRNTASGGEGYYTVPLLQPAEYKVAVQKPGFKTLTRANIKLVIGQVARVDFTLELGELTQTVEVTTEAPLVDRDTSAVGQVIDSKRILELPLNGRNFVQLTALTPGTLLGATDSNTAQPYLYVNGNRNGDSGFQVDGADNFDQNQGTVHTSLSLEAVQEFKVQSSTFSADSGRQAAIVSVVTKSGTNQFRGNVFEFVRNKVFDARNFFSPSSEPEDLKRNQFGGTLGGPIIRDRLFFFGSYEGTRQRLASLQNNLVPSQDQRRGSMVGLPALYDPATTDPVTRQRQPFQGNIIPASRLDPIATALLDNIPLPNSPGDRYILTTAEKLTDNQYNLRTDYKATEKDSLFFRFTQDHRTQENPGPFGTIVGGKQDDVLSINGVLSYTRLFSPTKI
ncbi:MAG: carboxypeptidase-like regulatory domain-containing protein, partial [Acidobacteria bacterium]|nr:carboxypeptidase-like regulatory domain-containing protein [Acidobacteriota bacterium]